VRALVVALVVLAVSLLLQVVFVAVFWLAAQSRGTTAFAPSSLWSDIGQTVLRVSGVATAFGLIALSIAMIGRSTVSSLGVLVGYLILFEGVIAGFKPSIQGWLLMRAGGVVVSQSPILDYGSGSYSYSGPDFREPAILMSVARADVVLGVYVVALLVLGLVVFRRRDVS
jgi:ABC-2 type transport system permease protein